MSPSLLAFLSINPAIAYPSRPLAPVAKPKEFAIWCFPRIAIPVTPRTSDSCAFDEAPPRKRRGAARLRTSCWNSSAEMLAIFLRSLQSSLEESQVTFWPESKNMAAQAVRAVHKRPERFPSRLTRCTDSASIRIVRPATPTCCKRAAFSIFLTASVLTSKTAAASRVVIASMTQWY